MSLLTSVVLLLTSKAPYIAFQGGQVKFAPMNAKALQQRLYEDKDAWTFVFNNADGSQTNQRIELSFQKREGDRKYFVARHFMDWPIRRGNLKLEPVVEAEFSQDIRSRDVFAERHRGRVRMENFDQPLGNWKEWSAAPANFRLLPGNWGAIKNMNGGGAINFVASPEVKSGMAFLRKDILRTNSVDIECLVYGMTLGETRYEDWRVPKLGTVVQSKTITLESRHNSTTTMSWTNITLLLED